MSFSRRYRVSFMSEDSDGKVSSALDRIMYFLVTPPEQLVFDKREKSLLHFLHEQCDGDWSLLSSKLRCRRDDDPGSRLECDIALSTAGWMQDYESIYGVKLTDLYCSGATRTI